MRAFVFTDPALTSRAGQFVWLEMNADDEKNAALAERLSGGAFPPFFVLAPAARPYREALGLAPAGWPPYGRAVVALLFLQQSMDEEAKCLALAREALPRLSGASAAVMVARSGLDCALGLKKEDTGRAAAIAEVEAATRRTLADPTLGAIADDVSSSYLSLIRARKDAGDVAGAPNDAQGG